MNAAQRCALAVAASLACGASLVHGQANSNVPHIGYVFPAGGQVGTSIEVRVGGMSLEKISQAHISGGGVRVTVGKFYRPLNGGEYNSLRQKLDDQREIIQAKWKAEGKNDPIPIEVLAKAAGVTDDQLKEMEIYRQREADPKRQPNVQILEEVTLHIKLDASAPVGERELRLITPTGMSNPLWFQVSPWAECRETEPNDKVPDKAAGDTLPAVINGQIMPGDVDRFAIKARKGQHLVIAASARELIPYLADAVPGWFQAVISLSDANGDEVAYAGSYYFRQDPVIYYEVPQDGEYRLEIRDSIYRGREDFVYRIAVGEIPFVTGIFPLGGRAGTKVSVELQGWNLHNDHLIVDAIYDRGRPLRKYQVKQSDKVSIPVSLAIDMLPEVLDKEPNETREQAQDVEFPVIVNGTISKPGDRDFFRFEAHGKFVAEVFARRFGSPVDSWLTVTDADGKELASNDDYEDKGMPLITHHADSRILTTLPGTGKFCVGIRDAQTGGGKDFIYRLHIRRPKPDFDLRVVPSSIIARPGGHVPITVYALRRDGFDDDILLELDEAPPGFALSGNWVPGNQDKVRLTLAVPNTPTPEPISLTLQGKSQNRDLRLSHPAMPADDMMQAFAYHHLVPAKDWTVFVSGNKEPNLPLQIQVDRSGRLKWGEGESLKVLALPTEKNPPKDIRLDLREPPDGITVESCTPEGPALIVTLKADPKKVKLGQKGNLVFEAFREWTATAADGKSKTTQRSPLALLPAVPYEVVKGRPAARGKR